MKSRVMIQKRIPKYFHYDGNGVHLQIDKEYLILKDKIQYRIRVIGEYRSFYLVIVNNSYRSTVNKLDFDFAIIRVL